MSSCDGFNLKTLFESFLSPVGVSVVPTQTLGVLADVRTLGADLGTWGDAGLPLEADW